MKKTAVRFLSTTHRATSQKHTAVFVTNHQTPLVHVQRRPHVHAPEQSLINRAVNNPSRSFCCGLGLVFVAGGSSDSQTSSELITVSTDTDEWPEPGQSQSGEEGKPRPLREEHRTGESKWEKASVCHTLGENVVLGLMLRFINSSHHELLTFYKLKTSVTLQESNKWI